MPVHMKKLTKRITHSLKLLRKRVIIPRIICRKVIMPRPGLRRRAVFFHNYTGQRKRLILLRKPANTLQSRMCQLNTEQMKISLYLTVTLYLPKFAIKCASNPTNIGPAAPNSLCLQSCSGIQA